MLVGLLTSCRTPPGAIPPASPIVVMDFIALREALDPSNPVALRRHYDEVLLASCLQGLVNRHDPRLFVRYNDRPDDFWFERMTEPGAWMSNRPIERVDSIRQLLAKFPNQAKGLLVWDERVPATSNVGVTVAGVEDLLAVRYDERDGSLYRELTSGVTPLPVMKRLLAEDGEPLFTGTGRIPETRRESTGSAKNDAYIWLLDNYVKPGRTHPAMLGYYLDAYWLKCWNISELHNHMLGNLDFLVANRTVVMDLNVWPDEAAVDDPKQNPGTDLATLREILMACVERTQQQRMVAVFGFPPWAFKYTDHRTGEWSAGGTHGPVATEWRFVELISAYNAYKDADALGYSSFPNASFYQHYEVPGVVKQRAVPTRKQLVREGILDRKGKLLSVNYYAHYQGDFDAAAWVYWHFPKIWNDPARGTLPQTWAINPTIAVRFPFGLHTIRNHSAPGEVFVAGEGAGYVNTSLLQAPRPEPGLADALDLWTKHSQTWYRQWDLRVTGFNIDGRTPSFNDRAFAAYRAFSPGGIGLQMAPSAFGVREDVPYVRMCTDLPGSEGNAGMEQTVQAVENFFREDTPQFLLFRSILQTPSYYAEIERRLQRPGTLPNKLVDMPTLFWLVREYTRHPEYGAALAMYAGQSMVRAAPGGQAGLRRHAAGDGIAVTTQVEGVDVWSIDGKDRASFLYFGAEESFSTSIRDAGVTVRVTYLDRSPGVMCMHYDSLDRAAPLLGAYKPAVPVPMLGTGDWRTAQFVLPDAQFKARQNGSSDFRLHARGLPLFVRSVEVEKR